jgi:hypothetical protein
MKRIGLCLLAVLLFSQLFSQSTYLRVQHPQQTWRSGTGTINDATIVLHPRGAYLQCDLYLLFSANGLSFTPSDSVEVQLDFTLPTGALVTDLWLWVDNQIMRGLILDRWTASSIYEGIVKRRRDPCLLMKSYTNSFSARIYPLIGTGTRRIMVSYLVPVNWGPEGIAGILPSNLLKASRNGAPMFRVRCFPDDRFQNPRLIEVPSIPFQTVLDSLAGPVSQAEVPGSIVQSQSQMTVSMDCVGSEELFLSRFQRGSEGFYQLAFIPSKVLNSGVARKVAILVDYDSLATTVRPADFLGTLRTELDLNFSEKDSLTIIFQGRQGIERVSPGWLPGSSQGIDIAFWHINASLLSSSSSLKNLLIEGGRFVQERGGVASLFLVSASAEYRDPRVANPALTEIMQSIPAGVPIHIVSFPYRYYKYVYLDGKYYYNNDYLFTNLSNMTKGVYFTDATYVIDFPSSLRSALAYLRGTIEALDVHTGVEGGFCAARYMALPQSAAMDAPFIQVGKYFGAFPFVAEINALQNGQPLSRRIVIPASPSVEGDSTLTQTWANAHITSLESQVQTSSIVKQTVDISIRERVLCRSTAFLALEPNDTLKACENCKDQSGGTTAVAERISPEVPQDSLVQAYPNPFNASTVISVRLPSGVHAGDVTLRVYSILGQIVRTFDPAQLDANAASRFVWDGRSDNGVTLASGMYLFVMNSPKGNAVKRLMLMK